MAFKLRPGKPFTAEFRSVAASQLSQAIDILEKQPQGPHEAVHEARKKFKRVRALYRLVQSDAREFRRVENSRIRDMAQTLSAVRDATALVETVDYLAGLAKSPEEISALTQASKGLIERRDRIAEEEHDLPAKMAAAAATCRQAVQALQGLQLGDDYRRTAKSLGKGWKKQLQKAQAALAECDEHADAEVFHDLRKAGQTYWMHLALLGGIWPSAMSAKQKQAKQLVDLLGHEHDLSVLTELVNESPELFGDSETLALVLGSIIAQQRVLRQQALEQAHAVFADDAEAEADLVALLWQVAAKAQRRERPRRKLRKTQKANGKETASA